MCACGCGMRVCCVHVGVVCESVHVCMWVWYVRVHVDMCDVGVVCESVHGHVCMLVCGV